MGGCSSPKSREAVSGRCVPMTLAFICSSAAPGKDGVGDYTLALAREGIVQGHECCVVAIHDQFIVEPIESEDRDSGLRMLRLPSGAGWAHRVALAMDFIRRFQPDWVSLQ